MVQEAYQIKYAFKVDNTVQLNLSLSLFIAPGQLQYAVFEGTTPQVIELADINIQQQFLDEKALLDMISLVLHNQFLDRRKFEKVNISFLNGHFTLLPEAFAAEADLKRLLHFTTGAGDHMKAAQHKTKYCDFCYALPADWLDFFGKTFPNASIRHAGAVSIQLLFEQFSLADKQVFINLHAGQMELAVKNEKQLQFYNAFAFETKEDILYYLLFAMEQLQLNPLLCKLAIAAEVETSDDLIKSLKKYVKHVDFCVFDQTILSKPTQYQQAAHYYFTVLNQHLCAL